MSQQKVDHYKEQKANRQQIMKKQKAVRRIELVVVVAAVAAALVWFGVSVYNSNKAEEDTGVVYIDSKAVVDYMNDPTADLEEDTEETEDGSEEETDVIEEAVEEGGDVEEAVIDEIVEGE